MPLIFLLASSYLPTVLACTVSPLPHPSSCCAGSPGQLHPCVAEAVGHPQCPQETEEDDGVARVREEAVAEDSPLSHT